MDELESAKITREAGLEGDHKGLKFKARAITILSLEQWREALGALGGLDETAGEGDGHPPQISWLGRRANLLVEGVRLPRARGARLTIGPVEVEVTYPTQPCKRMEEVHPGLLKALHPEWRGGVTARVLTPGRIELGDAVRVTLRGEERSIRLP